MCAVGTSQQFCVRWNSHLGSLGAAFPQLLAGQRFVDVTLACEGHQLHCHRLVLAACSTYFESLLGENPCKHPIIILPRDIKLWEIQALVDFMYKGEVNVSQAGLSDLLKCAEILQIRGLCGSDAALNLNQVNNSNTATAMTTVGNTPSTQAGTNLTCSNIAAIASSATTASSLASSSESLASNSHHPSSSSSSSSNPISPSHINATMSVTSPSTGHVTDQSATDVHSPCPVTGVAVAAAAATMATSKSAAASSFATIKTSGGSDTNDGNNAANNAKKYTVNENSLLLRNVKNEQMHRSSTPNRIDKIEPSSIDDDMMDDGSDLNDMSTDKTEDDSYATKYIDYLDAAKNENHNHHHHHDHLSQTEQQIEQHQQLSTTISNPLKSTPMRTVLLSKRRIAAAKSTTRKSRRQANCRNDDRIGVGETDLIDANFCGDPDDIDDDDEMNPETIYDMNDSSNHSLNICSQSFLPSNSYVGGICGNLRGKIRVKSDENLFENYVSKKTQRLQNYQLQQPSPGSDYSIRRRDLPGTLRFNRNSMTVYLKSSDNETINHQSNYATSQASVTDRNEPTESSSISLSVVGENDLNSIQIKTELDIGGDSNYESIVCLPNVMEMYNDDEIDDDDENGQLLHRHETTNMSGGDEYVDVKTDCDMIYTADNRSILHSPTRGRLLQKTEKQHLNGDTTGIQILDVTGRPIEFSMAQFLGGEVLNRNGAVTGTEKLGFRSKFQGSTSNRCRYVSGGGGGSANTTAATGGRKRITEATSCGILRTDDLEPTLSAVVLRNPRSNQPRTYSNDALYAALMDVKGGESIYRASQIHKVPRKTLRNWMKRWHIKSAYPMPRQLKQAAEKKKLIQQQLENGSGRCDATGEGHEIDANLMMVASGATIDANTVAEAATRRKNTESSQSQQMNFPKFSTTRK